MDRPDKILTLLEPPPGGWQRLQARRNPASSWAPSWWALASGSAAATAWLAITPGHKQLQMPLNGGRLIDQRSEGVGVKILESGRAVALPSANGNVRIYWVEPLDSTPAKPK